MKNSDKNIVPMKEVSVEPLEKSIMYHYCSAATLINIIAKKQLWLTDASKMNDTSEGLYALDLFKEMTRKHDRKLFNSNAFRQINETMKDIKKYLCCFSSSGDVLSQWRTYAEDGAGFAIGFNEEKLGFFGAETSSPNTRTHEETPYLFLSSIIYNRNRQEEEIIDSIKKLKNKTKKEDEKIINCCIDLINKSTYIKNPCFKEEKEKRIYLTDTTISPSSLLKIDGKKAPILGEINFRNTQKGLSLYFTLNFSKECITKIILGPQNKSEEKDIRNFLRYYDYPDTIKIQRSKATYENSR